MGNAIYLSRTRFETLDTAGTVISTTYGARIYDDCECAYANHLYTLDELNALDADGLIDYISEYSTTARDMLDTARYCDIPLYVDDELHSGGSDDDDDDLIAPSGSDIDPA